MSKIITIIKKNYNLYCKKRVLRQIPDIKNVLEKSQSTGISYIDIWNLYNHIKLLKPNCVLEAGPGVSTYVISFALYKNFEETGNKSELISMEDKKIYYEDAKKFVFPKFKKAKFILTKSINKFHGCFMGMGYKNIPKKNYDYIFIDGPDNYSKKHNLKTFNFDLIDIIKFSNKEINGIIDERICTSYVYGQLFNKKIRYSVLKNLTYINKVKKSDLKYENQKIGNIIKKKFIKFKFKYSFFKKKIILN